MRSLQPHCQPPCQQKQPARATGASHHDTRHRGSTCPAVTRYERPVHPCHVIHDSAALVCKRPRPVWAYPCGRARSADYAARLRALPARVPNSKACHVVTHCTGQRLCMHGFYGQTGCHNLACEGCASAHACEQFSCVWSCGMVFQCHLRRIHRSQIFSSGACRTPGPLTAAAADCSSDQTAASTAPEKVVAQVPTVYACTHDGLHQTSVNSCTREKAHDSDIAVMRKWRRTPERHDKRDWQCKA